MLRHRRGLASLAITDPLVLYKSLVSQGKLVADQHQLRTVVELQRLHYRVKDYEPPEWAQLEIERMLTKIDTPTRWRPLLRSRRRDLVKVLSDEDLKSFPSPHGLLINGGVGTGKTMLMDMFAQSLPKKSKQRWHYQNFMLWVYNEIHTIHLKRLKMRSNTRDEFILFEIAQKMISQNTVLILDEFMLPDLAAAKIVKLLFTYFFKLGGVLVATSNRMPEDLYATDFKKADFRSFMAVLQSRCYSLDIESDKDYRQLMHQDSKGSNVIIGKGDIRKLAKLQLSDGSDKKISVYGREVTIPWHHEGKVYFKFEDLCAGLYGPGDYISLASNFHTFVIDEVPVLKMSMKNEARRFITLLDALYESRCQLYLQLDTHPDELFFPDSKVGENDGEDEQNRIRVQEEEAFSKTHIALTAPYRPNISNYDDDKIYYKECPTGSCELTSIDYAKQKTFTGSDEKFAYKRALSRLKEMDSDAYKSMAWKPLHEVMRPWEGSRSRVNGVWEEQDEFEYVNHASKVAPNFAYTHFWSMGLWGKGERLNDMARRWIRGVSAPDHRY